MPTIIWTCCFSIFAVFNNQPGLDQNIAVTSDSIILDGDINLPYSTKGTITSTTGFPTRKRDLRIGIWYISTYICILEETL